MQLSEALTSAEQMTYLERNEAGVLRVHMHLSDLPRNAFRVGSGKRGQLGGRDTVSGGRIHSVVPCAVG